MRAIGLIGVFVIIRKRNWALLMLLASIIGYFLLIHIFNSSARYRLPIEPLLLLLALFGFDYIKDWCRPKKLQQPNNQAAMR